MIRYARRDHSIRFRQDRAAESVQLAALGLVRLRPAKAVPLVSLVARASQVLVRARAVPLVPGVAPATQGTVLAQATLAAAVLNRTPRKRLVFGRSVT